MTRRSITGSNWFGRTDDRYAYPFCVHGYFDWCRLAIALPYARKAIRSLKLLPISARRDEEGGLGCFFYIADSYDHWKQGTCLDFGAVDPDHGFIHFPETWRYGRYGNLSGVFKAAQRVGVKWGSLEHEAMQIRECLKKNAAAESIRDDAAASV